MFKIKSKFTELFLRYFFLVIISFPNLYLFYFIFTPLTIYPVYFLFSLFFDVALKENIILFGDKSIELIGACIAGSVYYLLLILNLSIPKIKIRKRLKMISFSFGVFLIINILRIFVFGILFLNETSWFSFAHKLVWYAGSTILVTGIWFLEVKLFKIKEIPFYSDLKFIYKKSLFKKR